MVAQLSIPHQPDGLSNVSTLDTSCLHSAGRDLRLRRWTLEPLQKGCRVPGWALWYRRTWCYLSRLHGARAEFKKICEEEPGRVSHFRIPCLLVQNLAYILWASVDFEVLWLTSLVRRLGLKASTRIRDKQDQQKNIHSHMQRQTDCHADRQADKQTATQRGWDPGRLLRSKAFPTCLAKPPWTTSSSQVLWTLSEPKLSSDGSMLFLSILLYAKLLYRCKYMYTHTYVHTYIRAYVHAYMHTCVHIHTYIHTLHTDVSTILHICQWFTTEPFELSGFGPYTRRLEGDSRALRLWV